MALQANLARLKKDGRLYLWTFTRAEVEDYLEIRRHWNRLLTYLRRRLPNWRGVRVYEVHPGRWNEYSHGLHVHVVCNCFHDVNVIRNVAKSARWGRVHVTRVRPGSEMYVGKYIGKKRPEALKGWRLQATFGMKKGERTSQADIICDSLRSTLFRIGHAIPQFREMRWPAKLMTITRWHRALVENRAIPDLQIRSGSQPDLPECLAACLDRVIACQTEEQAEEVRQILGPVSTFVHANYSTSAGSDDRQLLDFKRNKIAEYVLNGKS